MYIYILYYIVTVTATTVPVYTYINLDRRARGGGETPHDRECKLAKIMNTYIYIRVQWRRQVQS